MRRDNLKNLPVRYYSSVSARKVEWLWFPYIPYGKITVVQGDPGDGKTTLVLNLAAILSNGGVMPGSEDVVMKGKILYQSAEDGAEDTIKPRLISAGADCNQIAFIDDTEYPLSLDSPRLESAIRETGANLLVLDPLQAYLGENGEMNRAEGIRPVLKKLAAVAGRTKCAIVVIGHMNKAAGTKGLYRGLGSIDIAATARSVLLIGRARSNPDLRVMVHLKSSLAREGRAIAFEIDGALGVHWLGECDVTAEELLSGAVPMPESGKVAAAELLIQRMLIDGAKPCAVIYSQGTDEGIGKRTIDTAKKKLKVKSEKRADGWYWSLYKEGEHGA